jgi:hypothetical protein
MAALTDVLFHGTRHPAEMGATEPCVTAQV